MDKEKPSPKKTVKEMKTCTECEAPIFKKAEICPKCGVRQNAGSEVHFKKEKLPAALLAIFLGGIGAHKFYFNQPVMGIIYLLFFWTFIPAILGLLEGLCYLSMKEEDFDKRYNKKSL